MPMSLLLQSDALNAHRPFHLGGGGCIPLSLKERCLGEIPVSSTPTITPRPYPKKLGVCVVWRDNMRSGRAEPDFLCHDCKLLVGQLGGETADDAISDGQEGFEANFAEPGVRRT
ncbi:hypothetical protein ACMD2_21805 [Ananas comosus]|uniref:Uncharacterized protein n=1 Tax=Ananas comosus TaxID=4615 RepID=A0A199V3I7_ANACO|nr:hypothetical protein ACMD2_21805 [Ananas comosus]